MCGIAFLYDEASPPVLRQQRMQAALALMLHRGPDQDGIETAGAATLGHRRLSIIDLSGSRQPMREATGRYWLTYNGEIYNYAELRWQLQPHWSFTSQGDTEVLLAGVLRDGARFLRDAEGMWAFALWDRRDCELLLSRDKLGKKPLYFASQGAAFACASELAGLRALLPDLAWSEDPASTADYLRYGFYMPGATIYQGVREVLPGHLLRWSPQRGVSQEPYWSPRCGGYAGTRKQAAADVRQAVKIAVERRLVADVEVGAFLSGGIDSSIIVSVLCVLLGRKPKTFTVGFGDSSFDERAPARELSAHWGTEHVEELLRQLDPERLTRLVLSHVGQPFGDSSLLPTALVSEVAGRYVKVVLSGDGGDEFFCGYERYRARALLRWISRVSPPLRRAALKTVRWLPEPGGHHSSSLLKKAHLFADLVERDADAVAYVAPEFYSAAQFAALAPGLAGLHHAEPAAPQDASEDALQQMMLRDALVYLPQDIMLKVDRASMAYSIEARAPFLDRDLVELAFSLPPRWHRDGLRGKAMLRRAFRGLVPDFVWNRPKQGFAVPVNAWFRGALGQSFEELLRGAAHLDPQVTLRMLAQHRAGVRDHGYRLWIIYVYLLWRSCGARPLS